MSSLGLSFVVNNDLMFRLLRTKIIIVSYLQHVGSSPVLSQTFSIPKRTIFKTLRSLTHTCNPKHTITKCLDKDLKAVTLMNIKGRQKTLRTTK